MKERIVYCEKLLGLEEEFDGKLKKHELLYVVLVRIDSLNILLIQLLWHVFFFSIVTATIFYLPGNSTSLLAML